MPDTSATTQINVRNVDEQTWNDFRGEAVRRGEQNVGGFLSRVLRKWLDDGGLLPVEDPDGWNEHRRAERAHNDERYAALRANHRRVYGTPAEDF